jgi:hypothetical protein
MEGDLLALRHRAGNGASAVAVWAQRERVEAQWAKGAGEAGAEIYRRPWQKDADREDRSGAVGGE